MNRLLLLTLIITAAAVGMPRLGLAADRDDQKLAKEFNVKESRIDSLRRQKLGYGEIRHVLSIAEQMPGGIDNDNIKRIMDMRQGAEHKEGWGHIAQELGVKLHNEGNEHAENHNHGQKETHGNKHLENSDMPGHSSSHELGAGGGGMGHKGK